MPRDDFERRRRTKLVFAVLGVGIFVSALLAGVLVYLGQKHPGF